MIVNRNARLRAKSLQGTVEALKASEVAPKREVKEDSPAPVSKKNIAFFDRLKAHQSSAGQKRLQQAIEKALEAMKAQPLDQVAASKRKPQSQNPSPSPSQKQKLLSCDVREQFAVGMKQIRGNIAEPAENHATVDWSVPNVLIAIPETSILKAQPVQVASTNDILDALEHKSRTDLNVIAKKTRDLLSAT